MVIFFDKLSRAVDAFNDNRIETEQVEFHEVVKCIDNPLDPVEVLSLIVELYEDAQ